MPDQFEYDVFLSHTKADKDWVRDLAVRLSQHGVRVWFDESAIEPGDNIYLAIQRGLSTAQILILCVSPAALAADWVEMESSVALFRDPNNKKRRFVPIRLADCELPDTLRPFKYIDFVNRVEEGFEELLKTIRKANPGLSAKPAVVLPSTEQPKPVQPNSRNRSLAAGKTKPISSSTPKAVRKSSTVGSGKPEPRSVTDEKKSGKVPQPPRSALRSGQATRPSIVRHSFEKGLVCIWVDNKIAGTGFVVAEGMVVTCAHVVSKAKNKPLGKIQVESFLSFCQWVRSQQQVGSTAKVKAAGGLSKTTAGGVVSSGPHAAVEASIDWKSWKSEDAEDIAVLKLKGALPGETQILRFSRELIKEKQEFSTRGFPRLGTTHGLYAKGKFTAQSYTRTGQESYQLACSTITRGFSGAPLCDRDTGAVLGMINAIATCDLQGKMGDVAFAIPNSTLFRVVEWLRPSTGGGEEEQRQKKLADSEQLLVALMDECLRKSKIVWDDVANRINRPDLTEDSCRPALIMELRKQNPERLVSQFEILAESYKSGQDAVALSSLTGLFAAIAPAKIDSKLADSILTQLGVVRDQPFEVPWESMTMFEYVMARMDGRAAAFRMPADSREVPRPRLLLDSLPEQGFDHDREMHNLEILIPETAARLGRLPEPFKRNVNLDARSVERRAAELNKTLKLMHQGQRTPFLKAETDSGRLLSEKDLEFIHRFLTFLAVVHIRERPDTSASDDAMQTLTRPINDHTLLPPIVPKT